MNTVLLFLNLGGGEVIVILLVILILFGGKGIPGIARTLGKSVREFKDAASGIQREITEGMTNVDKQVHDEIQEVKKRIEPDHKDE